MASFSQVGVVSGTVSHFCSPLWPLKKNVKTPKPSRPMFLLQQRCQVLKLSSVFSRRCEKRVVSSSSKLRGISGSLGQDRGGLFTALSKPGRRTLHCSFAKRPVSHMYRGEHCNSCGKQVSQQLNCGCNYGLGKVVAKGYDQRRKQSVICKTNNGFESEDKSWQRSLLAVSRTLALCTATICLAWVSGVGFVRAAGDGTTVVLPVLAEKASRFRALIPPTLLQVLGVLKDQGLLLSALLGLSAFFSMAETSITTLWPWKVRELAEKDGEGGVFSLLRQDVTRFLTTILIGTTVVNIAATAMVTEAATTLFGEAGVTAATGVMTVVILLVTEIAPKSIAVHHATEVARFTVRPVAWLSVILYPVGRVVTALSMGLLKVLGLKSSGEPIVSEEELKLMLRGAELSGAIEEEEQDMIENVLEIKDTHVREVMTPLVDVVAIDATATLLEFRNLWVKHQYSRVPVFERRVDNIVGIAYAMDMLDYVDYDAQQVEVLKRLTVGRIAHRPAYFVPDSMSVWNLLREFRIRKVHMAIVLNEYGGTVGVVTLEDVVEEIVGEIFDENDSKEEIRKKTGYVVQRADGVFDVDANTHIEDLSEALEVKMPEGSYRYETVSGFVCEAFGYIPRTGERISVNLRKADTEDSQERRDAETDFQEEKKDKFQKFRLEILAGNARKVGAVRFEMMDGAETREDVGDYSPRIFSNKEWDEADDRDESMLGLDENCIVMSDSEEEESEKDSGQYTSRDRLLVAESAPVECEGEARSINERAGTGDSEEWELVLDKRADEGSSTSQNGNEVNDCNSSAVNRVSNDRWVERERQVERRRQRRKKQAAEAALELDRQRRADARRREVDLATAPSWKGRDEGGEVGSLRETSS